MLLVLFLLCKLLQKKTNNTRCEVVEIKLYREQNSCKMFSLVLLFIFQISIAFGYDLLYDIIFFVLLWWKLFHTRN